MRPQSQQHSFTTQNPNRGSMASRHVANPAPVSYPAQPDTEESELYHLLGEEQRAERRRRIHERIEYANEQAASFEARRPQRTTRSGRPNLRLIEGSSSAEKQLTEKEDARFQRLVKSATHRPPVAPCHWGLLVATLILTILSIPLVYSASAPIALDQHGGDPNFFLFRQIGYAALGLIIMVTASRLGPERLRGFAWGLYGVAVLGLLATKFSPLGETMGNVERWVKVGPVTFQFSELLKIALIGVMADFWSRAMRDKRLRGSWLPWGATALIAGLPIGLVFIQPHLSAVLILCALPLAIAIYAGASWKHIGTLAGGAIALGIVTVALCGTHQMPFLKEYQQDRIYGHFFKKGKEASQGDNFQALQGVRAISRGGVTGVGPGNSIYKYGNLPAPHTDFIYPVIGEEWGLLGTLGLIGIYGAVVFFCFQIGHSARDGFSALVCAGVGTLIAIQALGNIAVVTRMMPVTGMPLPIITYGGSGLWCALLGIGLVLAVSRSHGDE